MSTHTNLKAAALISIGLFIVMLFGAVYFYSERILFSDASYIAFQAINDQALQIQQFRFGAFITQMVPVIGAKLGLSVKSIMIAYSGSFHVFYLLVALILFFGFKAYRCVVLFAFYWILVTTYTFFWPNNEVHQGIAYMFLLFPALTWAAEKKLPFLIPVLVLLVLGTTAIFCHPLVLPPFIFIWVYLVKEKKYWQYNTQQTIVLSVLSLAIVASRVYVSNNYSDYDVNMLNGVSNMRAEDILGAFTSPLANEIYRRVHTNYWILPIVALIGIGTLVYKRMYFLAVWTLGCTLVYFILLCLTFTTYMEFITESEMMAGIIIATAPFVFETLTSLKKGYATGIVLIIFTLRLVTFYNANGFFTQRVQDLAGILAKMKKQQITKLVLVKDETYSEQAWGMSWGVPLETLLLSASIWDKPARQFLFVHPSEMWRISESKTDIVGCFEIFPKERIDRKYFPYDTTRSYTVMKYGDFVK